MPASIEATIADALLSHLGDFPAQTPSIDIAYPDVPFEPVSGRTYLDTSLLFNAPANLGVADASCTEFRGILQVTVVAPAGRGIIAPIELAAKVADHFERGTSLGTGPVIKIVGRPAIANPAQSPDRIRVPVSVSFSCFA
jgi:hypothetical protein